MALEGNIRDFGITDILQLIGMQQKSGILTLSTDKDTVTMSFEAGQVVGAESYHKWKGDLLGESMVAAEILNKEELERALVIQQETGKKLGHILVDERMVRPEEISTMLQLQVRETAYEIFEWKEGKYRFEQKAVTYDKANMKPIPCDRLLMEGVRIMDEWPIVRKAVPSNDMVFRKTDARKKIEVSEEDLDKALDNMFESEGNEPVDAEQALAKDFPLSQVEEKIYSMVDGRRTAQQLVNVGRIGTFETCKALYSLQSAGLIEEAVGHGAVSGKMAKRGNLGRAKKILRNLAAYAIMLCLVGFLIVSAESEGGNLLFSMTGRVSDRLEPLRKIHAIQNMNGILFACKVHYLETRYLPGGLEEMVQKGILNRRDLLDPWGSPYRLQTEENRIILSSAGRDRQVGTSDDLIDEIVL